MRLDLHNHTKNSDGVFSVKDLLNYKLNEGMDIISVTDHDNVNGFNETKELNNPNLRVIMGVELSTFYKGDNIHLLGYFYNNETTEYIIEFLNDKKEKRKARVQLIIDKLKEHFNIEISYEDVIKYADGAVGRVHVAKAIKEKYGYSHEEIFDKFIGNDSKAYVKTDNFALEDAIKLLHNNNAIAVIAHPGLYKIDIDELLNLDIDGIEVYHPSHTPEQTKRYEKITKEHNLLITGGSDFHEPKDEKAYIDGDLSNKILQTLITKQLVSLE